MNESNDTHPTSSRRSLLKKGVVAGGVVWAVPTIDSFLTRAAAVSGTVTTALTKVAAGSTDPPNSILCTAGTGTAVSRGSVTYTRNENPARLTVCISSSIGQPFTRDVYIFQSSGAACLNLATALIGTFVNGTGTLCYTVAIVPGATNFVAALEKTGGGGNDSSATVVVSLP